MWLTLSLRCRQGTPIPLELVAPLSKVLFASTHTRHECTREKEEEQRAPTAPTPPQAGLEPGQGGQPGQGEQGAGTAQGPGEELPAAEVQPGAGKEPGEPAAVLSTQPPPAQLKKKEEGGPGPELKWSSQTKGQGLCGWGPG